MNSLLQIYQDKKNVSILQESSLTGELKEDMVQESYSLPKTIKKLFS